MKILIIGGDERFSHLAASLDKKGVDVCAYALPVPSHVKVCTSLDGALSLCDTIILPLPLTRDGHFINTPHSDEKTEIDRVFSRLGKGKVILAGKVSHAIKNKAQQHGLRIFDYYECESFTDENAYITAEGGLQIAMLNTEKTLRDSAHLIIGAGRIAKHLLLLLHGVGAHATLACRNRHDILWARSLGASVVDLAGESEELEKSISLCDVIYNTVPEQLIPDECCKLIKKGALYVELVGNEGLLIEPLRARAKCICAKALPPSYAPESASRLLCRAVLETIEGRVNVK